MRFSFSFTGPRGVRLRVEAPSTFLASDTEIAVVVTVTNSTDTVLQASSLDMRLSSESSTSIEVDGRAISLGVAPGASAQLLTSFPLTRSNTQVGEEVPEWMAKAMDSVTKLAAAADHGEKEYELGVKMFFEGHRSPATDRVRLRRLGPGSASVTL